MSTVIVADSERGEQGRGHASKRLLLSFLGEFFIGRDIGPVHTGVFLELLAGAGIAAPAGRATLDRLVINRVLLSKRRGRQLEFSLTAEGRSMLSDATVRVHGPHPFHPNGAGWTLVTFTLPEELRTLRSRLRSTLTWQGFAPIRDGLWLAPGSPDLTTALEPLGGDLPSGALVAFHAHELADFPIASSVTGAWDIAAIRQAHHSFIESWSAPPNVTDAASAVLIRTILVADWLELLRTDPRLPPDFMGEDWPAEESVAIFHRLRGQLAMPSEEGFAALVGRT